MDTLIDGDRRSRGLRLSRRPGGARYWLRHALHPTPHNILTRDNQRLTVSTKSEDQILSPSACPAAPTGPTSTQGVARSRISLHNERSMLWIRLKFSSVFDSSFYSGSWSGSSLLNCM